MELLECSQDYQFSGEDRTTKFITLTLIVATLEISVVVSVMPFMALVTTLDAIDSILVIETVMKEFNLNHSELLYFASFCLFGLLILTGLLKAYLSYFTYHYCYHMEKSVSSKLFSLIMKQSYLWYTRHEESLKSAILIEVRNVVELGVLFLRSAIVCFVHWIH